MKRILQLIVLSAALIGESAAIAQSSPMFEFDIPPADLSTAVQKFAATIGGDAVFDNYAARNARTQAVRGTMTAESALNQMLAGTGLTYRYNAVARRVVVGRHLATAPATVAPQPAPPPTRAAPATTPQASWPEVVPAPAH